MNKRAPWKQRVNLPRTPPRGFYIHSGQMGGITTLPRERRNMIVQIINDLGSATVRDLSERFGVTEDSIRKDLTMLQKDSLLKKTYGGAMRIGDEQDFFVSQRKGKYTADKQKIAKKALRLLHNGDLIFLDISTTNIELAQLLKTSGLSLTVVTNMIDVMLTMSGDEYNDLIFVGGTFNEDKAGFVGALANQAISHYHFDKAFMGVASIQLGNDTVTTYNLNDSLTKAAAMEHSEETYLLLETRKLDRSEKGGYIYASLNEFTGVITDKTLEPEKARAMEANGLQCL